MLRVLPGVPGSQLRPPCPIWLVRGCKAWALVLVLLFTSSVALGLRCLISNTGGSPIYLLGL